MANTPRNIKVGVELDHPAVKEALKTIREAAFLEGVKAGRKDVLDYLQHKYLTVERTDSLEADAVLTLAADLAKMLRQLGLPPVPVEDSTPEEPSK